MKLKKSIWITLTAILTILASCERDWNNPWDDQAYSDPISWAPSNLQIIPNSVSSITLTWQDNSSVEEGFIIDRKKNQDTWEVEFAEINADKTTFTDDNVDLKNNDYTYRVYSFVQDLLSQKIEINIECACGYALLVDERDGNEYETVQIGDQCWMKENLAYLPAVFPSSTESYSESIYYVYNYNGTDVSESKSTTYYTTYGVLYNWPAAMNGELSSNSNPSGVQGICPAGWHLPSVQEWAELIDYLGGESSAGGKLKEQNYDHWFSPNIGATNESSFSGLPGGFRSEDGNFYNIGYHGKWWSGTEYSSNDAFELVLGHNMSSAEIYYNDKQIGISVRCIKND